MTDRGKVIKGLECCQKATAVDPDFSCEDCPYNGISDCMQDCRSVLCADALELLKPVEPIPDHGAMFVAYRCGNCKTYFYLRQQKYCAICGRAVKWDEHS